MKTTITMTAPLRKWGNVLINLSEVSCALPHRTPDGDDAMRSEGVCITMKSGERVVVPERVYERWFADIFDEGRRRLPAPPIVLGMLPNDIGAMAEKEKKC